MFGHERHDCHHMAEHIFSFFQVGQQSHTIDNVHRCCTTRCVECIPSGCTGMIDTLYSLHEPANRYEEELSKLLIQASLVSMHGDAMFLGGRYMH